LFPSFAAVPAVPVAIRDAKLSRLLKVSVEQHQRVGERKIETKTMNYSTITQKDEPILNREVKLSLKTILGAAAFVSFVIGSLAVVAVAPSQSNKDVAFYNHHGWNGDGTCDRKTCDPDSTSNANCPSKHCPLCLDQGDGYRCTSHGEVHPKATSPTCEELYATALKKLAISQEQDKLHQLAMGGEKFSEAVSDEQLDEQLKTLRKKVEIAELREKLDHLGG